MTGQPPHENPSGNSLAGRGRGRGWLGQIDAALEAGRTTEAWEPRQAGHLTDLLPAYRILSFLGRGGMAAVYLAEEKNSGQEFAVKLLPPELGEIPGLAARFRREARLLEGLTHPHIIRLHDTGETAEGHLFYVMEHVRGEDLARQMARSKPGLGEAVAILRQICEGVSHAHALGILHRDLKPSNILLGSGNLVKVGDFGLAVQEKPGNATRLTASGMAVGTLEYAAPEQLRGEPGTVASDIFSLGVIAYEMFTGVLPKGSFDAPSRQRRTVDPGFDSVILRALHPDPFRRQASVAEFQDGLAAAHETALLAGSIEVLGAEQAQVLEKIYKDAIETVPEALRHFVEDKLLTLSGYRESRTMEEALAQEGVTREAIDDLIARRLLRLEHRWGGERVEISHDLLALAVQASRDLRRAAAAEFQAAQRERALRRAGQRKLALLMSAAGVILLCLWGWSQHREARLRAVAENAARRHLTAMLEVSTGPMTDQLEQLGRLAVFDSLDAAAERALAEYAPQTRDQTFPIIEARYWDSRGMRLAARGRREEAQRAFITARARWRDQGQVMSSVLSGIKAAEQQWHQGLADAMDKTLAETRPDSMPPGKESRVMDTMLEVAAGRALELHGRLNEAVLKLSTAAALTESLAVDPDLSVFVTTALLTTRVSALSALAQARLDCGDFPGAESAVSCSIEAVRLLRQREPGNFRNAELEARALMLMVKIAGAQDNRDIQESHLLAQTAFTSSLCVRDPANVVWRGLLAASIGQKGQAMLGAGHPGEALGDLEAAARTMMEVAETDPTNEMWQWDAAGYLLQTGYALEDLGQNAEAEPFYRKAIERMIPFANSPDSPSAARLYGLSAAIGNLGDCLKRQKRFTDAAAYYQTWVDRAAAGTEPIWTFIAAIAGHEIAGMERVPSRIADAVARHRAVLQLWGRFFSSIRESDRPQPGWAWRHRPAAACTETAQDALRSSDPEAARAGLEMAREALKVFFPESVKGLFAYPAKDEAARSALVSLLTGKLPATPASGNP
ncbi:MAG: serine/threonine-protein kinase [Verrucomicrobiota bacterium]